MFCSAGAEAILKRGVVATQGGGAAGSPRAGKRSLVCGRNLALLLA